MHNFEFDKKKENKIETYIEFISHDDVVFCTNIRNFIFIYSYNYSIYLLLLLILEN